MATVADFEAAEEEIQGVEVADAVVGAQGLVEAILAAVNRELMRPALVAAAQLSAGPLLREIIPREQESATALAPRTEFR